MMDAITLAFGPQGTTQAKRALAAFGVVLSPPFLREYTFHQHCAGNSVWMLKHELVCAAARGAFVVRAQPKGGGNHAKGRRAIHDHPVKGPAALEAVPRWWLALDFDSIAGDADPLDGPACCRVALALLPAAFRDAGVLWQLTASAGVKPGIRVRLWFWLTQPIGGAEAKAWLKPQIDAGTIDPSTLEDCQPIFVGVIGGPQVRRWGVVDGPPVPVPAGLAAPPRAPWRPSAAASGPPKLPAPFCRQKIRECLGAIRAAQGKVGARVPAFRHHGARALWFARAGGIDPASVEDALHAAGEHLFDGDGGHVGRNVEGLLEWWSNKNG